jgi:hypothetical protein
MCRRWFALLILAGMFVASAVLAAPQQVTAAYSVTRNGQPFATVVETFRQQEGHYYIDSVTEGIGVYRLFGKRRMVSNGDVTAQGLRPVHFEQWLGDDERKTLSVDFDWSVNNMVTKAKGKVSNAPMSEGTQDLLSYTYQFMFRPLQAGDDSLSVTTGKKLRVYQFKIADKDMNVETAAGTFRTIRLASSATDGNENKVLWLGVDKHNILVRLSMKDENGTRVEQTLSSLHVE